MGTCFGHSWKMLSELKIGNKKKWIDVLSRFCRQNPELGIVRTKNGMIILHSCYARPESRGRNQSKTCFSLKTDTVELEGVYIRPRAALPTGTQFQRNGAGSKNHKLVFFSALNPQELERVDDEPRTGYCSRTVIAQKNDCIYYLTLRPCSKTQNLVFSSK